MSPSRFALSFGQIGGRAIFVDLDADLYFLADAAEEQALIASAVHASPVAVSASIIDRAAAERASARDARSIFVALIGIRRALRTRRLADIVERIAAAAAGQTQEGAPDASLVALRFAAARKAVPVVRNCLPDSLALIAWLGGRGIPSTLVFGAKLDPFAAHCWVQTGDLLLSDRVEEIELFTPVRSIECAPATL